MEAANPILSVLGPMEALREKAFELDESAMRDQVRQSALEEERRQAKLHQQDMLQDIVQLHHTLKTGYAASDLDKLADQLREHIKFFSGRQTHSLADQGLLAILHSVHDQSLLYAWELLNERLTEANLKWPPPLGMSPSSSAEEIQVKTELHLAKLRQEFLSFRGILVADLLVGLVPAWRSVYPERNGPVWTETVYQAVGGAMAVKRFHDIVATATEKVEALRSLVSSRLSLELQSVQDHLAKGVSSIAEARSLSEEAASITQKVACQEFWAIIGPLYPKQESVAR
ncbi:hypothetical protein IV102_20880 [bacterium]|nr:hypothetical protein [bacterium]